MRHINQVEARIPEETAEFLEHALDREERCVSAGGLASEVGLLRAADVPAGPESAGCFPKPRMAMESRFTYSDAVARTVGQGILPQ